jgi:hypothetical protein
MARVLYPRRHPLYSTSLSPPSAIARRSEPTPRLGSICWGREKGHQRPHLYDRGTTASAKVHEIRHGCCRVRGSDLRARELRDSITTWFKTGLTKLAHASVTKGGRVVKLCR